MTSVETLIIISIIILIIVVVAFMLIMNRKQLHQIEVLDKIINKIEKMHLEQDIDRLDKMDLAGESLHTLNTWRKSYQENSTSKLPEARHLVEEAADLNTAYRLFKARKDIKQANEIVKQSYEDAKNTKEVFTELLESNRENQVQYDALIKTYREIRKNVLAASFDYGVALDEVEDELSAMDGDFEQAKNLSSQGDHVEAKRVLSKIRNDLKTLEDELPKLREGHHQIESVFQDQLRELSNTYKNMLSEKYYITKIDILEEIKKIHTEIDSARSLLADLKLDDLIKKNQEISKQIDGLYTVLEKEYKARPFVEKIKTRCCL